MRLLFVCVGNSCRSQMAEGIARHLGHEAASAGTHPARQVSAHALTILAAKGIDTSTLNPNLLICLMQKISTWSFRWDVVYHVLQ